MSKKLHKKMRPRSWSFLPSGKMKTYLFIFSYSPHWWNRWLKGYTHVCIAEKIDNALIIVFEPTLARCETMLRALPMAKEWDRFEVLEVTVLPTKRNRLIKFMFQTCATFVQYLAGFDVGALTAEGLYKKLTRKTDAWLSFRGIIGVEQWV